MSEHVQTIRRLRELEHEGVTDLHSRALAGHAADAIESAELALSETRRKLADCAPYLKDGETPAERIERERKDCDALLTKHIRVATERDELKRELDALRRRVAEPTDAMNDAARYVFMELANDKRDFGGLRTVCRMAGVDTSNWPRWAKSAPDSAHIPKRACTALIWHHMAQAMFDEPKAAKDGTT